MPFSHQTLLAREHLEKELEHHVFINTICEQGQLYGHLATKFLNSIKSNDEFDKIVNELFLKHGYRLVKVGSGNFVVNSIRFNPRFIQEDPD